MPAAGKRTTVANTLPPSYSSWTIEPPHAFAIKEAIKEAERLMGVSPLVWGNLATPFAKGLPRR